MENYTMEGTQNFLNQNGIEVKGWERMPELGMSDVFFANPWNGKDEDIYFAEGMRMTVAKDREGRMYPLNKVSEKYKLVQHYEAVERTTRAVLERAPEFGRPTIDLNFSNDGGLMVAKLKFNLKPIEIRKKDDVIPVVVVSNSADCSTRYTNGVEVSRLACLNGLVVPDARFPNQKAVKRLHKDATLDLDVVINILIDSLTHVSEAVGLWKEFSKKMISRDQFLTIMDDSPLSVNQAKQILEIPLRGFSSGSLDAAFVKGKEKTDAWTAYNAVTQWITDNNKNEVTAIERGRAVSDLFDRLVAKV